MAVKSMGERFDWWKTDHATADALHLEVDRDPGLEAVAIHEVEVEEAVEAVLAVALRADHVLGAKRLTRTRCVQYSGLLTNRRQAKVPNPDREARIILGPNQSRKKGNPGRGAFPKQNLINALVPGLQTDLNLR